MSHTIQAVIWDLDGVIIDSADAHRKAWYKLAEDLGIPYSDEEFWATFGQRNDAIIPRMVKGATPEQVRAYGNQKEAYFREFARETLAFLPGAQELLRGLREAGFRQALASSTPMENIELISEVLGLHRYLDTLVSGESVPHGKPAPDVFLKAAEELGAAPAHSLVIEDAVAGVQAARAGGMYCIAVVGERDLPGLRAADLVVRDLTEVSVERIQQLA
ncbi:beta-phosphoglucomutase [Thermosporothrix hazakensis]|jgi:beta-phosphoglucomutase|uniref:Beta-phosphoglucomutase n=2 Tax=Thermosporothrix TaxID=768650 RepID=A0A326UTS8_THEHA|nr:HAD family phosphatase [Thermosporothrix hazakensis]PZW36063.1 beta-phosphoglucomutase [Thermosporothrix hazakensis]BBH88529.1 beta-phosphoglucomutase [Thermosporothrix sp. COM3]GCE46714.1 beta-phosphoglucomutase [Thermosporothrix hazakensis]